MEAYQQLEQSWSGFNGLNPSGMVACASGSAALLLALEALQLPQGSEVLVPDFTMYACPRAVVMAGLTPVFVDVDERGLMDADLWASAIDGSTRAVMFVHIYGRRCTFPQKWDRCSPSLRVIEDLAEVHGVKPHPATDAACWSHYRNKIVCGEEAGTVWFRDPEHAKLARQLRSLGFNDQHDFWHLPRAWNHRLSNANAELVLVSLARFHENTQCRRWDESQYDRHCPNEWKLSNRNAPWVYDLRIPGLTWDRQLKIVQALNAEGMAARCSFKPCSRQREFQACRFITAAEPPQPPRSTILSNQTFYLPLTPGTVTAASAQRAFEVIRRILGENCADH